MTIIWYVFVPKDNSTQRSHATNQSTVDGIADKPLERQTKSTSLAALLRNRNVLILSLSYTCEGYVLFIFVVWLYIYLVEVRGFTILSGAWQQPCPGLQL
jgi:MFS transporter, ACS family, glucarate transporter